MIRAAATVVMFTGLLVLAAALSRDGRLAGTRIKFPSLESYFAPPPAPPPVAVPLISAEDTSENNAFESALNLCDLHTDTLAVNVIAFAEHLDPFFDALYEGGSEVRIAHYGDSQIEGDRITEHFRRELKKYMGGGAPGFVPFDDPATNSSYERKLEGRWKRHSVFQPLDSTRLFGVSGVAFRFDPERPAAVGLRFFRPFYDRVQLLRGPTPRPCTLSIRSGDSLLAVRVLPPTTDFAIDPLPVPPSLARPTFVFSAPVSPELYGLTFDACSGVRVDNFGLRGHSGMGFLKIPTAHLGLQLERMGYKLVILQFGGNVVPYEVKDFDWYRNEFYKLIMKFKRAAPEAAILVVGVSDAARKTDDVWRSYPSVEQIRRAQRLAAEQAGAAFWDLYEVMGGENSIVAWVHHQPPLAANDYAHFSPYGQRIVGKLLASAVMKACLDYAARKGLSTETTPVFTYLPPTYLSQEPPDDTAATDAVVAPDTVVADTLRP
ncbi:MAG: GDSL-type esterase/lipase family protein [Bacteroidia bacterium]|nr:GDSL-type esterase/lipase family protein [Bacteroidia bacterium]